jgi:hypothetical protein
MFSTKPVFALFLLASSANPAFAAGNDVLKSQAQAWEKVAEANTISGEVGSAGLVFQAEVDQYARELAAGKVAPDAGHAAVRPVSPKPLFIIDASQSQTGG